MVLSVNITVLQKCEILEDGYALYWGDEEEEDIKEKRKTKHTKHNNVMREQPSAVTVTFLASHCLYFMEECLHTKYLVSEEDCHCQANSQAGGGCVRARDATNGRH